MLNVMTINIRYGSAASLDNRKDLVIERIRTFDPGLLGLQECRDDEQAEFMRGWEFLINHCQVAPSGVGHSSLRQVSIYPRF